MCEFFKNECSLIDASLSITISSLFTLIRETSRANRSLLRSNFTNILPPKIVRNLSH